MVRLLRAVVFASLCVLVALPAAAADPPGLVYARALYNVADFDGAIAAATPVLDDPQWADAAALVVARAHLERYRQRASPSDLADARAAIGRVRAGALAPRDQVEHLVGLGQSLYLSESFGASAELFDTALHRAELLAPRDRLLLLDWWATALDRDAQTRPPAGRPRVYERILERMEQELAWDASSAAANYWLAVAARGTGDVDRAWHLAVAGWVRSTSDADGCEALRADLDRLVVYALIPERAYARGAVEQKAAAAALRAEWELVKDSWK